jgi:Ni/Co efflux regulator RcnB
MKSPAIVSVITAATLGFSSLTFAQDHGRGDGHGHRGQAQAQGGQPQHQRGWQPQYQQRQDRQRQYQPQYRQPQYQQYRNPGWQQQRVYTPQAQWDGRRGQWADHGRHYRRGEVLPWQYRQRPYYVNDWRVHRGLYAPPYGYQWVQDDAGDFILVALATGLIANLLINSY